MRSRAFNKELKIRKLRETKDVWNGRKMLKQWYKRVTNAFHRKATIFFQ